MLAFCTATEGMRSQRMHCTKRRISEALTVNKQNFQGEQTEISFDKVCFDGC